MPYSIAKSVSILTLLVCIALVKDASVKIERAAAQTIQTQSSLHQFLKRIFRDDEWEDPPTISRGELCLLSPARAGQETVVWHQRPVFIWRGEIAKMAVVDSVTGTVVWEYRPIPEQKSVRYAGQALRSGRSYYWQVYDDIQSTAPVSFPPFEVMSHIQRRLIANGLAVAESQVEEIAAPDIARIEYFASRGLPTDALQSLFLVDSEESDFEIDLEEARKETVDRLCK